MNQVIHMERSAHQRCGSRAKGLMLPSQTYRAPPATSPGDMVGGSGAGLHGREGRSAPREGTAPVVPVWRSVGDGLLCYGGEELSGEVGDKAGVL